MVDIHNNIDFDWIYNSVTHIWCHCSNLIWILWILWTISSCIWFCDFACLVRSFLAPDPTDKCDLQRMQYASFMLRSLWLSQLNSASQAFWYLHKYFFRLEGEEQAGPDKDLFLPVDILQKWFNFFIVKTTQTFHKGIKTLL